MSIVAPLFSPITSPSWDENLNTSSNFSRTSRVSIIPYLVFRYSASFEL